MFRPNEAAAAEFLRVTEDQLAEWREAGDGPDFTSLRGGSYHYSTPDMKQWLRRQLEARRANASG